MKLAFVVISSAVLAAVLMASALAAATDDQTARYQRVADRLVKAYNAQDAAAFRADFNKVMADFLTPDKTRQLFTGLQAQFGAIKGLGEPLIGAQNDCVFPVQLERGALDMRITLDGSNQIAGLFFAPPEPRTPVLERNKTALMLPGRGEWLVFWGGDTQEQNQHHGTPNQRYAFDLLMADKDGNTHKGTGQANEDYYAFGKEVLAPATGEVTDVISGVRDNRPGSMNPYSALGNAVIIRHSADEVSVLAHLKLGSARVNVGDRVEAGQVIGLCGNSGNSSEPHIHYHLQQTPIVQDGRGIKCHFARLRVMREGKSDVRDDYSPVKGDHVENAAQ